MNIASYVDGDALARRIVELFEAQGMRASCFDSAGALMRASHHGAFDSIVMDTGGAGACGSDELVAWMRGRAGHGAPVIVLCADNAPDKIVRMLDGGADDVVAKPFFAEEVAARVRVAVRRAVRRGEEREHIEVAGFTLDRRAGWLLDRGRVVDLTPREFDMAWVLFSSQGTFVSRASLSQAVWGLDKDVAGRTIEQHAYMLRKKLNLCDERGVGLRAAYGKGYRIEVRESVAAQALRRLATGPVGRHSPALAIASMLESSWPEKGLSVS